MILEWLDQAASVDRHVTPLYFMVVAAITFTIYIYACQRDRDAVRFFWYSAVVWMGIEGFGLLAGLRVYEAAYPLNVFFCVAILEDAGWCTLGFLIAKRAHRRWREKRMRAMMANHPWPTHDIRTYATSANPLVMPQTMNAWRLEMVNQGTAAVEPYEILESEGDE